MFRYDSDIGTETDSDFDSDDSEAEEKRKKKAAKRKSESKPRESKPKKARADVCFYFDIKFFEVPSFILALLNEYFPLKAIQKSFCIFPTLLNL